jgi:hypothetical protein
VLTEHAGPLDSIAAKWDVSLEDRDYEAAGGDVVGLHFAHPRAMLDAFTVAKSPFVPASRALNLRLMRKGPTVQWRGHCFDLADRVVQPVSSG